MWVQDFGSSVPCCCNLVAIPCFVIFTFCDLYFVICDFHRFVFRSSFISTLMLGLALTGTLHSATGGKRGTAGAQELLVPVGGRATALGGSAAADVAGAEALFWNPAGIVRTARPFEALFFHQTHLYDIANIAAGATVSFGEAGTVGLLVRSLQVGAIPVTTVDRPYGTGDTYTPSFVTYGIAYGRRFTDMISLGVTVKLVTERVLEASAVGLAFDAGLQYRTGVEGLEFGFVIQNIGNDMRFDGESLNEPNTLYPNRTVIAPFPLPTTIQIGATYDLRFDDAGRLRLMGKVQSNSFDTDQYIAALEYSFADRLFLRGSADLHGDVRRDAFGADMFTYPYAAGAGVRLTPSDGIEASFDYAFRYSRTFTGSHSFGLTVAL